MTIKENNYVVAMEECNELSKELSKILRFGLNNKCDELPDKNNANALLMEYFQLKAMMEKIIDSEPSLKNNPLIIDEENIKKQKLEKVAKYVLVSKQEGRIEE